MKEILVNEAEYLKLKNSTEAFKKGRHKYYKALLAINHKLFGDLLETKVRVPKILAQLDILMNPYTPGSENDSKEEG